jgi:hypothetical protein
MRAIGTDGALEIEIASFFRKSFAGWPVDDDGSRDANARVAGLRERDEAAVR